MKALSDVYRVKVWVVAGPLPLVSGVKLIFCLLLGASHPSRWPGLMPQSAVPLAVVRPEAGCPPQGAAGGASEGVGVPRYLIANDGYWGICQNPALVL